MVRKNNTPKARIGVISDTHGLVRLEAISLLKGVDLILHAGDIGTPQVLQRLSDLAPVIAVYGNNDTGKWVKDLPESKLVQFGDVKIYVLHNLKELDLNTDVSGFHAVVSGHSHKPSIEERNGVLYVNPGSAGPRRFKLPVSMALLTVDKATVRAELIEISV